MNTTETYLIRYWKPGKYNERAQYTVDSTKGTEGVLTEAKNKVANAADYSWSCDWLSQGGIISEAYKKQLNSQCDKNNP